LPDIARGDGSFAEDRPLPTHVYPPCAPYLAALAIKGDCQDHSHNYVKKA
jgi:hypothetical protein